MNLKGKIPDSRWNKFEDPHTVANLLVTFLLQLPEPLLCFDLYDSFIAAMGNYWVHFLLVIIQHLLVFFLYFMRPKTK